MLRILLSLLILIPGVLNATELTLKRRYEHRFDGIGWSLFPHGSKLVALNRKSLRVEVLEASTGKGLLVDSLDSRGSQPRLLETLSDSKGEFLIALTRNDNAVELHAVNSDVSWEVESGGKPLSLQLIEGKNKEVYLVVATTSEIGVYRRSGAQLETVRVIKSEIGNKQVQAMRSNTGLIVLSIFDRDNQIHAVQLDLAGGPHEHVTLGRPSVLSSSAQVDKRTNDYITALISRGEFRFYVEGEQDDSDAFPMDAKLFPGQWLEGSMGHALWASAYRTETGTASLTINDPYLLSEPVELTIGPAKSISNVGTFRMRARPYFFLVKDQSTLLIQGDGDTGRASASFKNQGRIVSVQVVRAAKALAVLVEDGVDGTTRLEMIGAR